MNKEVHQEGYQEKEAPEAQPSVAISSESPLGGLGHWHKIFSHTLLVIPGLFQKRWGTN